MPMTSRERLAAALAHRQPDASRRLQRHGRHGHARQVRHRASRPLRPGEAPGQGPRALPDAGLDRRRPPGGPRHRRRRRLRAQQRCSATATRTGSPGGWTTGPSPHVRELPDDEGRQRRHARLPEGDRSPPSGRLPKNGFFFDTIIRQDPIDEDKLDPADNLQEFGPVDDATLDHFETESRRPGPPGGGSSELRRDGPGRHRPRSRPPAQASEGIRDVEEWYVST